MPGVHAVDFDQCQHGAESVKPTRPIYFGVDVSCLHARCQHGTGAYWVLRGKDPRGGCRAKAAAACPRELCFALA
eukprot:9336340-Alexandrium_andersonii.AAC.1